MEGEKGGKRGLSLAQILAGEVELDSPMRMKMGGMREEESVSAYLNRTASLLMLAFPIACKHHSA